MENDVEQLGKFVEDILKASYKVEDKVENKEVVKESIEDKKEVIKEERDPSISSDGWNKEYFDDIGLNNFLDETASLKYEIDGCIRGSYTSCKTRDELEQYLIGLSVDLNDIIKSM